VPKQTKPPNKEKKQQPKQQQTKEPKQNPQNKPGGRFEGETVVRAAAKGHATRSTP
jgi:hypothetical protein